MNNNESTPTINSHLSEEERPSQQEVSLAPDTHQQANQELIDVIENQVSPQENSTSNNLPPRNNISAILARGKHEADQAYKGQWAFLVIPMAIMVLSSIADPILKLLRIVVPSGREWLGFVQSNIFSFLQNSGIAATGWATFFENYATYTGNENSPGIKEIYNEIIDLHKDIYNTSMEASQEVLQARRYFIANVITSVFGTILPVISFLLLSVGTLDAELKKVKNNNSTITPDEYEPIINAWGAFAANLAGNILSVAVIALILVSHKIIAPKLNTILNQANHKLKALDKMYQAKSLEQKQNKEKQLKQELKEARSEREQLEGSQQDIEKALQTLKDLHDWCCDSIGKVVSEETSKTHPQVAEFKQQFTHQFEKIKSYLQPIVENPATLSINQRRGSLSQISLPSDLAFEQQLNLAALESQRSITQIRIGDENKLCQVVPAKPDGNCGFTSIRYSLHLQDHDELAEKVSRPKFIELVKALAQAENISDEVRNLITDILQADTAANLDDWCHKFQSSGYWLQDAHLRLLSHVYNLRFEIYYLPSEQGENLFKPEPSYEAIDEGTAATATIALAHVSTKLKDRQDATLNHFDAIIIEPTESQLRQIKDLKRIANEEQSLPRAVNQRSFAQLITQSSSLFTKPKVASEKDIQILIPTFNEALGLNIKTYTWQLEQTDNTVSLTLLDETNLAEELLKELKNILLQTFTLDEQQITLEPHNLHIQTISEPFATHIKNCLANSELKPRLNDNEPSYGQSR